MIAGRVRILRLGLYEWTMVQTGEEPTTGSVQEGSTTSMMPSLERFPIVSPDGVLAQEEDGPTSSGRRQVDLVYPSNSRMRQITNQPNQTSNEDGTKLSQDYHTV